MTTAKIAQTGLRALSLGIFIGGLVQLLVAAINIPPAYSLPIGFGIVYVLAGIMTWDAFRDFNPPAKPDVPEFLFLDELYKAYPHLLNQFAEMVGEDVKRQRQIEIDNLVTTNRRLMNELDTLRQTKVTGIDETELKPGWVYLVQEKSEGHYKIGKSLYPVERIQRFDVLLPFKIDPICQIRATNHHRLERDLHAMFADKRVGKTEWFQLVPADVDYIRSLAQE